MRKQFVATQEQRTKFRNKMKPQPHSLGPVAAAPSNGEACTIIVYGGSQLTKAKRGFRPPWHGANLHCHDPCPSSVRSPLLFAFSGPPVQVLFMSHLPSGIPNDIISDHTDRLISEAFDLDADCINKLCGKQSSSFTHIHA